MFSRIWLINFILAVCVALLGFKAYGAWTGNHEIRPEITRSKSEKQMVKGFDRVSLPPEKTFEAVVGKNLFSPDRTDAQAGETGETNGTDTEPILDADVEKILKGMTLYGVVIMDDHREALVVEGASAKTAFPGKRSRPVPGASKSRWIRVGDVVGGLKVAGISAEKVSLTAGPGTYDLFLHDTEKPKSRAGLGVAAAPTVVVHTGAQGRPAKVAARPGVQPRGGARSVAARQGSAKTSTSRGATRSPFQKAGTAQHAGGSATAAKNAEKRSVNPFEKVLRMKGALQGK